MTDKLATTITLLQHKLRQERNIKETLHVSEHNGFVFTEVEGVSVTIGSNWRNRHTRRPHFPGVSIGCSG